MPKLLTVLSHIPPVWREPPCGGFYDAFGDSTYECKVVSANLKGIDML